MLLNIVFIIVGIAVVLWGADRFTDGASAVARRFGVSELVIGLSVVALGTSLPEFMVSLFSAIGGKGDMSVGNILGSNIFNELMILGVSAMMAPVLVSKKVVLRDMMMNLLAALLLICFVLPLGQLDWRGGLVLVALFCCYMGYTFVEAFKDRNAESRNLGISKSRGAEVSEIKEQMGWGKIIFLLFIGMVCLVGGGDVLVDNASAFARACGMSERMVGLTILAAGTSLPEFATSVMAAHKGSHGLAVGNAVGSNIFNIMFVLGVVSLINPLEVNGIHLIDWAMLVGGALLLMVFGKTGWRLSRWEGAVLVAVYLTYLSLVIVL